MKTLTISLFLTICSIVTFAQTPIIFQPGPGLNDGSDMGTIDAGMDAFIVQNTEGSYGDNPGLMSLPPSNCNETESIIYMRFDISILPTYVDSVFVNFHHFPQTNYCYSNCDAWWSISPLMEEWDEMGVDWFNDVNYEGEYVNNIHFAFPDTGGWHKYDITNLYNDWNNGNLTNYGIAIHSTTEGCNNAAIMFYAASSDDTTAGGIYRPYLEIYESSEGITNTVKTKLNAKVFPNPAQDNLTLTYDLFEPMPVGLRLQGLDGRTWFSQSATEQGKGSHSTPINITKLAAGIYMLVVETPIGTIREKVLVQ